MKRERGKGVERGAEEREARDGEKTETCKEKEQDQHYTCKLHVDSLKHLVVHFILIVKRQLCYCKDRFAFCVGCFCVLCCLETRRGSK